MGADELDLVATLKQWRDDMSPEVRMVFDVNDTFTRLLGLAMRLSSDPEALRSAAEQQATIARRMEELARQMDGMGARVSDWDGAARRAFDDTVTTLGSRAGELAELGTQGSHLLSTAGQGFQENDRLLADLVRDSIDYAERSLQIAKTLSGLTGGASLSTWTANNVRQVTCLVEQLRQATERVGVLFAQVTSLVTQLTDTADELRDNLADVEQRLSDDH
ncbi:hypothetical protein GCM10009785_20240 [Brooklawnia cerclae]|uniref:Uncharacterized protein YukE n=1 Tax=Brooklawnia cerclae TaxID=349934 RepID=A0ABX0SFX6_9ACTN|nr:WXG100 family type VII secretion target [Brooklawnia cerclae]NIH57234.1 uncharacterized protein YukE [Brooklawnia cerclae]